MSDWPVVALGDLVEEITVGFVGSMTHEYVESGVPFFRSKNISEYEIDWNDIRYISDKFHRKLKKSTLRPGDVAIVRTGKPGTTCVIPDTITEANCSDIVIVRVNDEKLSAHYLSYFMNSLANNQVASHLVGAVQQHFNVGSAKKIEIPLPSRDEQEIIVKVLKDLDDKRKLNRQTNQTLEAIAQAIFKSWFVDFEPTRAKIAAKECAQARAAGASTEELKEQLLAEGRWTQNQAQIIAQGDPELAAMAAISGHAITDAAGDVQGITNVAGAGSAGATLQNIAALFPDALVDSELGEIPEGWKVKKIGDVIERLKSKKRYTKKQVESTGEVPVYEQGSGILLGFHNGKAGFSASADRPLFIFGDHTCVIHLSCEDFDISQNVIPLAGAGYPTIWVYYAIQGKQNFQEYRRHWSELIIREIVSSTVDVAEAYSTIITALYKQKEQLGRESNALEQVRDSLIPKLLSGEI